MNRKCFTYFLERVMSNMGSDETHAIVHVATGNGSNSPRARELARELCLQTNLDVQYADYGAGHFLFFLRRVSVESALLVTRQLRFAIEFAIQPHYDQCGSFGLVCFDANQKDVEKLLFAARRAAAEAECGTCTQINYLNQTPPVSHPYQAG